MSRPGPARPRSRLRFLALLLLTVGSAGCEDSPSGPAPIGPPPALADPLPGDGAPRAAGETGAPSFSGALSNDHNVLFISLTNLRADHLSCYGYARRTSPAIDLLASRSAVFERAFSHASWTLPVAISIFTSLYPFTHGMMDRNEFSPLPLQTPSLIEILAERGWATAAFVGDRDYAGEFGLTSRFETLLDLVREQDDGDWKRYGVLASTVPEAIAWLERHRSRRFFLFVQGYDVHCPFAVPKAQPVFDPGYGGGVDFTRCYWTFRRTLPIPMRSASGRIEDAFLLKTKPEQGAEYEEVLFPDDVRHMVALYDGEILEADRLVGKLLETLARLDLERRTIVVLFSEHGDMFGKHGRFMRGGPLRGTFYDDVLRVPLMIFHPELPPRRIRELVEAIDLAPTLLEMLGVPPPAGFQGKSFLASIARGAPGRAAVFAGSAYTPRRKNVFFRDDSIIRSVRTPRWKLVHERLFGDGGDEELVELFDMENDADELNNVSERHPDVARQLHGLLDDWLREIRAAAILERFSR
jgi:arylsulfatase A-like enzyme